MFHVSYIYSPLLADTIYEILISEKIAKINSSKSSSRWEGQMQTNEVTRNRYIQTIAYRP